MNKKLIVIQWVCGLALLILLAYVLYNRLSERFKLNQPSLGQVGVSAKPQTNIAIEESKDETENEAAAGYVPLQNEEAAVDVSSSDESQTTDKQDESSSSPSTDNASEQDNQPIPAPDFTVTDNSGNQVKLSQLFGKPIVLNFWASWCPPCKSEMPEFNKVYEELGNDINFMMVDIIDGRETVESGKKYVEDNSFTFPVYFDTTQEAATLYGIISIPSTLFIDVDGNVVAGARGAIDEATLRKGIDLITENLLARGATGYNKITGNEAYEMMNTIEDFVLLDVRTQEEFDEERIDGAMLIPHDEIGNRAEAELDKDTVIFVYCRSGRRSEAAARELAAMGFKQVYDFGGIDDWTYEKVR